MPVDGSAPKLVVDVITLAKFFGDQLGDVNSVGRKWGFPLTKRLAVNTLLTQTGRS